MKLFLTNLMTSVALLCALGGGLEAQSYKITATVPFGYQVKGQNLEAGNYVITKDVSSPVMWLRNAEDGKSVLLMTIASSVTDPEPKLVFHRYGDRYFLAEIWIGFTGRSLTMSSAEKEVMASGKSREVATVPIHIAPGKHS
jgi:hypothetical protein